MITFLLAALTAAPTTLEADPNHSTVTFAVKHMMVTTVRGNFTKSSSALTYDPDDPTKAVVEVKIDPASVNTNNEKRDGHLKSPDFLDAQRCPEMTFKSTKVEKAGEKYKVTGDLNMHCVTKPLTLEASFSGPVKGPAGPVYAGTATGKLKRSEWGLNWNKALESGGMLVSDDVSLELDFEYNPKVAQAKK
ncbi:MAG TPA: YceI family protein [Myxococcales bacterium]|nr:YceI family protein [Myxococcales bacterium]